MTAAFDTFFGIVAPAQGTLAARPATNQTRPTVTAASGTTLTLGSSNTLRGFNLGNSAAAGTGLAGTGYGTLVLSELSITTTGAALNLNNGSGTPTFDSITSSGGTNNTVLTAVGGTLTINGGALSGASARAVDINGGAGSITYAGTISNSGTGISVASKTGGTVTFSGATKTLNTGTNAAVTLSGNTGATINFTNGGLDIDTTTGTGFNATGGGTINVSGSSNSITTTTGTGVNLNGIGGVISLTSVTTNAAQAAGAANGVVLQNTTGSFTVNGDGTNTAVGGNSTGGTISRMSGADGAVAGNGVYLNNAQTVTLRRMTINGANENHGIRGLGSSNFTLEYSTVSGANGTSVGLDEGSVVFDNLAGAAAITSSIIDGGLEDNLNIVNTSGTLNLIITGSTFGFNNTVNGNNNILLETQNAGTTMNFTLQSSLIKGARADWINASNNSGSTMSATIGGNTLALGNTFDNLGANAHPGAAAGGNRVVLGSVGTLTFDIRNNTMKGSKGEAIRVRTTATGATTGTGNGHVRNNAIGVQATANSGSSESFGIFLFGDGGSDMTAAVSNNTIYQYNNHGISLTFGDEINDGSLFNVTVRGNTVNSPGNINSDFNGIHLNNGTVGATDNFLSCVDIGGAGALMNNVVGSGNGAISPNNQEFRLRQRQATTVRLPGYGGANNNDAAVVTFLQGRNTVTAGNGAASNTVPTGGGFIGGAACALPANP